MTHVSEKFIGRDTEIATFDNTIRNNLGKKLYVWITGIAGIGKTALLKKLRESCKLIKSYQVVDLYCVGNDFGITLDNLEKAVTTSHPARINISDAIESHDDLYDLPLFSSLKLSPKLKDEHSNQSHSDNKLQHTITTLNYMSKDQHIFIFVDADLATKSHLRKLYAEIFESLTSNFTIVISTRHSKSLTDSNQQSQTLIFELLPLPELDIQKLIQLSNQQITKTAACLYRSTLGIPYLLAQELSQSSDINNCKGTYFSKYIERLFAEVQEKDTYEVIKLAAVYRYFNIEALRRVSSSTKLPTIIEKFYEYSFFEFSNNKLLLLPIIQKIFTYQWKIDAPQRFITLNRQALRYYSQIITDNSHMAASLEYLYHQLCIDEVQGLTTALELSANAEFIRDIKFLIALKRDLENYDFNTLNAIHWIEYVEGIIARLQCQWELARMIFERVIDSIPTPILLGYALKGLAETIRELGDWELAQSKLDEAIRVFEYTASNDVKTTARFISADIASHKHKWDDAKKYLTQALSHSHKTSDLFMSFQAYYALAEVNRSQGEWFTAYDYLEKASLLARELQIRSLLAIVLKSFGKLYRSRHNWPLAIKFYLESAALFQEIDDKFSLSQVLHSLAVTYLRSGNLQQSTICIKNSLSIKNSISDNFGIAKSLNMLGHLERHNKNYLLAIEYYLQALTLFKSTSNSIKTSRIMLRIGMTYAEQSKYSEAMDYFNQSKRLHSKSSDKQGLAEVLFEMGLLQVIDGDIATAIDSFILSVKYAQEDAAYTRMLAPTIKLALIYYDKGNIEEGTNYLLSARKIVVMTKQYKMMAEIYVAQAEKNIQDQSYVLAFQHFAEAIFAAAHESDDEILPIFTKIINLLDYFEESGSLDSIQEYSRKILLYWRKYCDVPTNSTKFWSVITSPETDNLLIKKENAFLYLHKLHSSLLE